MRRPRSAMTVLARWACSCGARGAWLESVYATVARMNAAVAYADHVSRAPHSETGCYRLPFEFRYEVER